MVPLVYVCVRPQRVAAEAEYASFRAAMGLDESELDRIDLTREPLPDDAFTRWRGFVVGGSPYNATDDAETKAEGQIRLEADLARIADAAAAGTTAALFTCYGIGVATTRLGGAISREFPEETGPTEVTLTDAGRADALLGDLPETFSALTAHKEGTRTLPPGAVLLATNPDCPVQAYRVGDRLYATQFHPEPTPRDFTERMTVYRNDGYFDAADYDRIAARVLEAPVSEPARLLAAFAAAF